jgi:VWFA-related protein
MKRPGKARFGTLIALLLALLVVPGTIHAQSTVDLAVHYVEGMPIENEIAYNVNVYLSAVGGTGIPIKDLTANSFTVTEDSQKVEVLGLELAENEPINIALVMDTSGSMAGTKIKDAKSAASNFISNLDANDRAAFLTFDEIIKPQTDFTSDRGIILDRIALVDANPNAGTCMYDAAYQAVQLASTLPSGRRAVILFTDGVDETSTGGRACSVHTVDDVIGLASEGGTRTPIYTLGLGNRIDENTLKRIADLTGGRYIYSPDSSQLDTVFQLLSDQLRSQYVLTYKSFAALGAHTLAVNVNHLGSQDSDTRNFLLPALPARINFLSPLDGEPVGDVTKVVVTVSGGDETIERVDFEVNGEALGSDSTTPYELEIDLTGYAEGNVTVSATAYGQNNAKLTDGTINLNYVAPTAIPPTATVEPLPTPIPTQEPKGTDTIVIVGSVLGGLGVVTILLLVFILARQKKQEKTKTDERTQPQAHAAPVSRGADADRTMDSYGGGSEALGALTVLASDDPSMVGFRFELSSSITTLGRSADNDINFPKDNPVSRRHAEIFERDRTIFIREVKAMDSSGAYKPPKYGTFVNDIPLGSNPAELKTGDEIRLGKRVLLKFDAYERMEADSDKTFDDMMPDEDPDKTMDQD